MLQAIDTTACLVPVDEQAEDQTPLREIQQAPSIWKKELQPYINCKNCTFGSKYTQSLQIRIKTVKYSDPYQLGKWIQENWASPIESNVFHDRIQEGRKVRIAYIINTADTTNYRELQVDLERHLNNLYNEQ